MSDFSDSDLDVDPNEEKFTLASEHVQRIHDQLMPDDLLTLYGLFKQATAGICNTPKPGIFNIQGRAKWNAWNNLAKMSKDEARLHYIETVEKLDPQWAAARAKGEKIKSPNNWVVHSCHVMPESEVENLQKAENKKNAFDYCKEGNLNRLKETISGESMIELDEHGMGLIHWAADRNSVEILEHLLLSGADVNLRDADQQTALHYAASCGNVECLQLLMKFNPDREAKDSEGQSAADVAENEQVRAMLDEVNN